MKQVIVDEGHSDTEDSISLVLSDLIEILVDVTDLLGTSADTTESLIAVATNNWAAGNFYNDTL